jgi:hypothetical protein
MPSDYSKFLNEIPNRTRQHIHRHDVPDTLGADNKMVPTPANRAERRKAGRPGGPFGYMVAAVTVPYEKPQDEDAWSEGYESEEERDADVEAYDEFLKTLPKGILATRTDPITGHPVVG